MTDFNKRFQKFACFGDAISCEAEGFRIVARLVQDEHGEAPDERQDGFWPSLDPKNAGYIGSKSKSTLRRHMARAKAIMEAWENDEWFYAGVVLSVSRNGVVLDNHAASLWGIEMNYPGGDGNKYLSEVANELIPEALEVARSTLNKLCAP